MALTDAYLVTTKNLEAFFNAIQSAQAPKQFSYKFLSDLGFTSSNDRLFMKLLKELSFLDESGAPQDRYFKFLDQSQSGAVIAEALKEAYSDLFALKRDAQTFTIEEVKNKLKTLTQGQKSDKVLHLMANTFVDLCKLADWEAPPSVAPEESTTKEPTAKMDPPPPVTDQPTGHLRKAQLHYNIQIHLPESRDLAVYDAIFQSLKKHLL